MTLTASERAAIAADQKAVTAAAMKKSAQERPIVLAKPLDPVIRIEGAALLSDVQTFIRRFCVFPDEHSLIAVTLWAAHAHMVSHFHTTPRLAVLSPEASSGKTRVLEVLDLLVPQSFLTLNASPAAIFRTLAKQQITLLFDEVDAIWAKRGQDDTHEDLRALLNAERVNEIGTTGFMSLKSNRLY